jgi:hypothetical protein
MIYRGPGSSHTSTPHSYTTLHRTVHTPTTLLPESCLSFYVFLCAAAPVELNDGRGGKGVGKEPSHTTFKNLWTSPSSERL